MPVDNKRFGQVGFLAIVIFSLLIESSLGEVDPDDEEFAMVS